MNDEPKQQELTGQEERDMDNAAHLLVGLFTPSDDDKPEETIPSDQAVA